MKQFVVTTEEIELLRLRIRQRLNACEGVADNSPMGELRRAVVFELETWIVEVTR